MKRAKSSPHVAFFFWTSALVGTMWMKWGTARAMRSDWIIDGWNGQLTIAGASMPLWLATACGAGISAAAIARSRRLWEPPHLAVLAMALAAIGIPSVWLLLLWAHEQRQPVGPWLALIAAAAITILNLKARRDESTIPLTNATEAAPE
jgi:hypothetical protein